jgi:hypothetical protein
MPRSFPRFAIALLIGAANTFAGSYGPQTFEGYPTGASVLNGSDGTLANSLAPNLTSVQAPAGGSTPKALRLTSRLQGGNFGAWKLPVIDAVGELIAFDASFRCQQYNLDSLADGFSLNFGDIPEGGDAGGGEAGFSMENGLMIAFDTYDNGGDAPRIRVYADNVTVNTSWVAPFTPNDTRFHSVVLHWDANGLDMTYDGTVVCSNLPLPGFSPLQGQRFAFSGRTGGITQDTFIDNVTITTTVAPPLQTGGVVITEFLADNGGGIEDEDGDTPDWIELYNGNSVPLDLVGWRLTNSSADRGLWTFPSTTLPAFGYLRVFASAKNRIGPILHTNFTLPKAGGYLALVKPDGVTPASEFQYPAQTQDVSYGAWGQNQVRQFFCPPSPGAKNESSSVLHANLGPAEEVLFGRDGGLISAPISLGILPPTAPGAQVRYTTDGTPPSSSSPLFNPLTPLSIASSTRVRARVYEGDHLPGPVKSRTFLLLDASLLQYGSSGTAFTSNLPIIVLESWGLDIDAVRNPGGLRPHRPVDSVVIGTDPANAGRATLTGPIEFQGRSGIHVRGQTSSEFGQKPYAWEIRDDQDRDKNVPLLGMPADGDWVLQTPYNDKTLMRNMLPYALMREWNGSGSAMRAKFVEVFFNQNGGPISYADYRGVYVLMERIERGKDRVPLSKLSPLATDPAAITGGYIFKKDKLPDFPMYSTTSSREWGTQTHEITEPSDASALQTDWLRNHIQSFDNALSGSGFADPTVGYNAYIDPQSFMDNHIWVEAFKQIDGYRLSTYYSKDRGAKIRALPIWDYNLSSGNGNYNGGDSASGWYHSILGGAEYPYYPRLFEDPDFHLKYWDRYWAARRTVLSDASIAAKLDAWMAELTDQAPGTPVTNGASSFTGWGDFFPTDKANQIPPSSESPARRESPVMRHFDRWPILGTYVWPNPAGYNTRNTFQSEVLWMKTWLTTRLAWFDSQFIRPPVFSLPPGDVVEGVLLSISNPNPGGTLYYTTDGTDPTLPPQTEEVTLLDANTALRWLVPSANNSGNLLKSAAGPQQWTNITDPPNIAQWMSGTPGVGYDQNPVGTDYSPHIGSGSNTAVAMAAVNSTCYLRIPFQIPNPEILASVSTLKLQMKFDDGFRAYLNGVPLGGVNDSDPSLSSTPSTAKASASVSDPDAVAYQTLDVTSPGKSALRVGTNVLAIHGLNSSTTSSDFLISPKLTYSRTLPSSGSTQTYAAPFPITASTTVRARVFYNNAFGPLTTASYVLPLPNTPTGPIVISEICFDPLPSASASSKDLEFLVLRNISNDPVDLSGFQFTLGVRFTFTGEPQRLLLPAGAECVLAANPTALALEHGPAPQGVPVFGPMDGALDNSGENLSLRSASGAVIQEFRYRDLPPWPVGKGRSIVLEHPESNPDPDDGHHWRPGTAPRGTPYVSDSIPFAGNWNNDSDGDGWLDGAEYALGTLSLSPGSQPILRPQCLQETVGTRSGFFLRLVFQRSISQDTATIIPEFSADLVNWIPNSLTRIGQLIHPDGTATETWRSTEPVQTEKAFARLRILPP